MPISVIVILSISVSASLGALLRFWLGTSLNSIFPTIPLGTLAANVIGGFLMGIFITVTKNHVYIPEVARLTIATGFLGGLTTFSTFSAESVTLLFHGQYFWFIAIILGHVVGSIAATILGMYTAKILIF
jgi:CrcB protein